VNKKLVHFVFTGIGIFGLSMLFHQPIANSQSSEICQTDDENDTYNTVVTLSKLGPISLDSITKEVIKTRGECTIYRLTPTSKTFITILPNSTVRFSNDAEKEYRLENYTPPAKIPTSKPRRIKPRLK
jgi:hypothetical protein